MHPNQISDWKKLFLAGANTVFEQDSESKKEKSEDTAILYEQIGRLQMDIAFLEKVVAKPSSERIKLVEKSSQDISVSHHQCDLLGLCRSRLYYKPVGQESEQNLILMVELDKQYLKTSFYGIRRMTAHLHSLGALY